MVAVTLALLFGVRVTTADHAALSDTVRAFVEAFNARDIDAMDALVTDDVAWLSITPDGLRTETEGRAALQSAMVSYFSSCSSCRSTLGPLLESAQRVAVVETAHWQTDDGPKSQQSMAVYELDDGRIRRVHYFPAE